jgi:hypothetical protein
VLAGTQLVKQEADSKVGILFTDNQHLKEKNENVDVIWKLLGEESELTSDLRGQLETMRGELEVSRSEAAAMAD